VEVEPLKFNIMRKRFLLVGVIAAFLQYQTSLGQSTQKPPLHGKHWMAITGKPLAATAGAMIFQQGGNAIDAACAMLAATCTMWDVLSWGGETQALIYNPKTGQVIGINALGVAPSGATPSFFKEKGYDFPPEYGPLAAVTPGTPGGLCYMLAEYGSMSLAEVLAPALEMALGYPIDAQTANSIEGQKRRIKEWPYSPSVFLPHLGEKREAPYPGELFVQKNLYQTLQKMVDAEAEALAQGKNRKEAIKAAYDRFYKGDIADEMVRGIQEQGGLITKEDLAKWKPIEETPLSVQYKDVEVFKLREWTQGPALLQALNVLEQIDIKSLKYNSVEYLHVLHQSMNLAFADRDFYYGDPYFEPQPPIEALLSKDYARQQFARISFDKNPSYVFPGDPYKVQGKANPYASLLEKRAALMQGVKEITSGSAVPVHDQAPAHSPSVDALEDSLYYDRLTRGTTSIVAADKEGWLISITPSGGWIPAVIAGRTGVGLSQRMQSFVLDEWVNPFNVVAPGKRPRVTLTPTLALRNGKPYMAFAVQGGDTQEQNLLQFFLNVYEFGMTVQQASEAANLNSDQLWLSLGGTQVSDRLPKPGSITLQRNTSPETIEALKKMGYTIRLNARTSGPINAIWIDHAHQSLWGASSNHGEDYGIGW
jgi:gamma-glutamyltranspeptidase/glutathione hydrolase